MKFVLNQRGIDRIIQGSNKALERTALKFESMLKKDIPKDTGETAKSIHTVKINENRFLVGSAEWSAYVMEHGRKAGKFPNLDALVGWAARKAGRSQRTAKYDDLTGKQGRELKSTVFLIARSIAQHGIKEKRIFSISWEKNKNYIFAYFYELMKRQNAAK